MRNAFSEALVKAATVDPKVLLLTGDHGYALFDEFRRARPEQYINCGIAEQNMVGVAAGLAKAGFRPIVYGLAAFVPMRVLEQIKIDICYENLPVVLIGDGAGLVYSHLGSSHQCTEDIACARAIPGLTVLSPADRFEMSATMTMALAANAPVYLRMGKSDRGDVHKQPLRISTGELLPVSTTGKKIALIATGSMVFTALELARQGMDAEVWSAPCLKPMSASALIGIFNRVKGIITMEEHSTIGGLGDCIAELVTKSTWAVPHMRIGVLDRYSEHCGSYEYLLKEHEIDLASVAAKVSRFACQLDAAP